MTTLYWDCSAGIAGNMAVASLIDLGIEKKAFLKAIKSIPFPEGPLSVIMEPARKSGIKCFYFNTGDDDHSMPQKGTAEGKRSSKGTKIIDNDRSIQNYAIRGAHDHWHHQNNERTHDHHHDEKHSSVPQHDPVETKSHGCTRSFKDIRRLIEKSPLSIPVKELAVHCFKVLGDVESAIHGTTLDKIHFHEVGARDSIADIVGAAFCFHELRITSVHVSPINVGSGFTSCQHGRMPIPAPATAKLLAGYRVFTLPDVSGELTTPTGAALIKGFDAKPGMPDNFSFEKIGTGSGKWNLLIPNILRAFLSPQTAKSRKIVENVVVLETNLDNATGELLGHALERMFDAGALDVTLAPIQMKKNRPGTLFSVMVTPEKADELEDIMFLEIPTLGIRRQQLQRAVLPRKGTVISSPFGRISGKQIREIDGGIRVTPEYESLREVAKKSKVPLKKLLSAIGSRRKG